MPLLLRKRKGVDLLGGTEITSETATRVESHLAALAFGPVDPARQHVGRVINTTNVAPHNLRLVVVRERVHLRHLRVVDKVLDRHPSRVIERGTGVGVLGRPAGKRAAVLVRRVVPLGQAKVSSAAQVRLVLLGRGKELADKVALGPVVHGRAAADALGKVEQGEAVVVLCGWVCRLEECRVSGRVVYGMKTYWWWGQSTERRRRQTSQPSLWGQSFCR